jgi:dTDP-4-dehydrorhamnose reductase
MVALLVFGADGQLGQEISATAAAQGLALAAVSHRDADIADASAVGAAIARAAPQVVVNAAAYTKVDQAESAVAEAFRANEAGAGAVATACAAAKVPLIHISTDYVFDGTKSGAYREDDPIAPLGIYGRSKAAGETAVRASLSQHLILRTSWVYGRYGANFLKTMLRLAKERDELTIVADQRGCPTGTADLAAAILRIAPRLGVGEPALWGTYHFAGIGVTTWHGFASEVVDAQARFTGRRPRVAAITTAQYPTPARRPANSELDTSKFTATFGFRAAPWQERARSVVEALLTA